MSDFSTATILRLAHLAARKLGVEPSGPAPGVGGPLRVALDDKRALLGAIARRHGALGLVSVSDVVAEAPEDAVTLALRPARGMADLIERWSRLEAYVHSRHRLEFERDGRCGVRIRHVSLRPDAPPLPIESLLVAGTLTGVAEVIGVTGVRVEIGGPGGLVREGGVWQGALDPADWAPREWIMRWTGAAPPPERSPISEGDLAERIKDLVAADPARRWTVEALGAELRLTPRTLQRRMSDLGTRCSVLIAAARVTRAAQLLIETDFGAAEIGYACGFSDQPHFSRSFRRLTALSPAAYRRDFRAA